MCRTILLFVLLVGFAAGQPPPFGTVLQQWNLQMSGSYAGAGVAWRRDDGRLYLMDQGSSGPQRVWTLDPADPENTIEAVPWAFTDFGTITSDIPWGIAWDQDSGCFWMSQIVDGNIYAGCFLLRYEWDDSVWTWSGAAADSWLVGMGSNGGGLRLSWLAGFEKWPGLGQFFGIPVQPPPTDSWHIRRFDPYAKDYIGLLVLQTSLAAVAFVPWDSAYVLAVRHTGAGESLYKYDSTGYLHERVVSGQPTPSDWTLLVPHDPGPLDTACVFAMYSGSDNTLRRISTGMLWSQLPSAFPHSVRHELVLAPSGVVDSGQAVTPRVSVRNIGMQTADSVAVHLIIDNDMDTVVYHDSAYVLGVPGRSVDTVEFVPWVPVGRDSMTAVAWTRWSGDSIPEDDTLELRFLVRVIDVAITAVNNPLPGDTIDPGLVYPQVELSNNGNRAATFPMVFNIGVYFDTVQVVNLLAGGSRTVTALDPWTATSGDWQCGMSALVSGDLVPENNDTSYLFHVRAVPYDMAVESIGCPSGIMDTTPFTPAALVGGTSPGTCTSWFWINDSAGTLVYRDKSPVFIPGWVSFDPCTLRTPGYYVASCSVYCDGDTNRLNDTLHQGFWVNPDVGVDEKPKVKPAGEVPEPTVVQGMLTILPAPDRRQPVTLHDPAGRLVMVLKPGDNDIRHVAPGIYFVRSADSGGRPAVRKLVVQR